MSSLLVDVTPIVAVRPHRDPEVERLEVAVVKSWPVVVPKGEFQKGELVLYMPPDAVIPEVVSDALGVTKYLSKGRVRSIRLRGEMSFGLIFKTSMLSELLGIKKWEPEVPWWKTGNDSEKENPFFHRYTDIENIRNFPFVFESGETVIATEKIHGTNSRVGVVNEDGEEVLAIGSHRRRVKLDQNTVYNRPLDIPGVEKMLRKIKQDCNAQSVILFGEIYGNRIQDLTYGEEKTNYRAFDIAVDGDYMSHHALTSWCNHFEVPTVPVLFEGPFNMENMKTLSQGSTTIMNGKPHIREGIVIRPQRERMDFAKGLGRRVILKFINDDYLLRKNGTENN